MSFCRRTLEIPKIRTPMILEAHNFVYKPPIEVRLKAKLYPSLRTFQWYVAGPLHARKSGRFLTFIGLSSIHNLCFNRPNGSFEPILDIQVPRAFQLYKELHNSMGFERYNYSLKIREFIGTPIFQSGNSLSYTPKSMRCDS
jgi:hypothetical protein